MFQRLPIILTEVSTGNMSESLLNEICQLMNYLYQDKNIRIEVNNNILNWIKVYNKNKNYIYKL